MDTSYRIPLGWPEAVTRLSLRQNVGCGFPTQRSSEVDLQRSESLQLRLREIQLWSRLKRAHGSLGPCGTCPSLCGVKKRPKLEPLTRISLWTAKTPTPTCPLLKQARAEYAKLNRALLLARLSLLVMALAMLGF